MKLLNRKVVLTRPIKKIRVSYMPVVEELRHKDSFIPVLDHLTAIQLKWFF